MSSDRIRLDVYLVNSGCFPSRQKAQEAIEAGIVEVNGRIAQKSGMHLAEGAVVKLVEKPMPYVGKGGVKLEKALQVFQISVQNKICADLGASTGGFTDCLLKNGAAYVYAVDVGHGQLSPVLQGNPRVKNLEGINIRYASPDLFPWAPTFCAMDVSFISLTHLLPVLPEVLPGKWDLVVLVKPQFEAGREKMGKNGVIKDPAVHREVLDRMTDFSLALGYQIRGLSFSPILGGSGNREYLLYLGSPITGNDGLICSPINIEETVKNAFEQVRA